MIGRVILFAGAALTLAGCAHGAGDDDTGINAYPTDYKLEILAAMHAYLNDPTGVRDAVIAPPVLEPVAKTTMFNSAPTHYVVCLRFTAKKSATDYAAPKELAAVFMSGRFDHFIETPDVSKVQCASAAYAPFPELQKLTR